ncbi:MULTISPECIES: lytic transglycosylase domain-containing protein [Burkholderia]|uniref:lytic transglycosylase domain-containing protein n=1 Tax=Burkholderia TaxID=32008 RepID=UPI0004F856F6|nr:lytic transglycosylase domain-containing protein [Burkholderia multivorans]AIO72797.1 transglycosylase SLT domain protein [Burkholderia multivorans]AOK65428.1 lytic transglycosylase [Burkholderia multivorans]KVZ75015.1 lytic transglycosylase [Burkholderia multivorans]MBU9386821.1 lytic transglycosylase domain-containing protein [Burkholderia multivorans]MBY4792645.1 lytic transglycosylase domain-containing protein [Burkholderia multivorans]
MNARRLHSAAAALCATVALVALAFACVPPRVAHAHASSGGGGFAQLARACAPNVDPDTLAALVRTESGFNPYAIGVVGGHLTRQPASLDEARATVRALAARGFSYSVGLAQVNERNFAKYGLDEATMFEPCRNLQAGGAILTECFARSSGTGRPAQAALRAALSCYYSGNFTTGFSSGYVSRVVASAQRNAREGGVEPIPVVRDVPLPARQRRMDAAATTPPEHARRLASPAASADAPSCHARPVVMMCRGLPASQAKRLCVRCLDQ